MYEYQAAWLFLVVYCFVVLFGWQYIYDDGYKALRQMWLLVKYLCANINKYLKEYMNLLLAFIRSCFPVFCCSKLMLRSLWQANKTFTEPEFIYDEYVVQSKQLPHKNKFHDNERWFYLLFLSRLCYCTQYKMCNGYNENMEYIFSYQVLLYIIWPHLHIDKYVKSGKEK